jgi:hypothetical protein
MKKVIVFLIIFTTFFSCKKDKLEGGKEILIGKWKWVYSTRSVRDNCDNPPVITILTPMSEGIDYSIDFKERGCVTFYKNQKKIEKYRIVFTGWHPDLYIPGEHYFGIYLNNKSENNFSASIKSDSLIERGFFPYKEIEGSCTSYANYFVRE